MHFAAVAVSTGLGHTGSRDRADHAGRGTSLDFSYPNGDLYPVADADIHADASTC